MSKAKTLFFCRSCGAQSAKWMGKCPACGEWNTYVEEVIQAPSDVPDWRKDNPGTQTAAKPVALKDISVLEQDRIVTADEELNRVLGGGIMPGSIILVGGEPGIGKSTLMLQLSLQLPGMKILYVSGEESSRQIKHRAERITSQNPHTYILSETQTQNIFKQIEQLQPQILIVDSIQTMQSAFIDSGAGSISQVRECTAEFMKYAKETGVPVFLVGHITKDGNLAGPKILEHMVDTVLQFEGDRHLSYRLLRTSKNRFGSTAELGIYEMINSGLRQVSNPSEILISNRDEPTSGIAISAFIEGNRPLLIETQALVSVTGYGTAQRTSTGFDKQRLNMLIAVLEKRAGYKLSSQDVFLNIAGGLKVEDPATDLAICAAIISSFDDVAIPPTVCFTGEVGLGGEIRAVSRVDSRISEAEKLGFKVIVVSKYNARSFEGLGTGIKIIPVAKISELQELINSFA